MMGAVPRFHDLFLWAVRFKRFSASPSDVMLVAFATVSGLGAILYWTGGIRLLSPYAAIPIALLLFTLAPGYLLVLLLQARGRHRYGFLTLSLLSTSLGFSWNFLTNVAVFLLGPNIEQTVTVYVCTVAVSYALALIVRFVFRRGAEPHRIAIAPIPAACGAVGVCLIYVLILHREPSFFYVEEFTILRKILSVPSISFDNIGYERGDRTTYIFVPFYLAVAMVTKYLDVDVFIGYLAVWPFTALISLACIAKLSQLLSGRMEPAVILMAAAIFAVLFVHIRPSVYRVELLPLPDRYSVAEGVLLPLALFHFFMHINNERFNPAMLTGLVYLIVENTFIHAKETLYILGIFTVYAVMLWIQPRWDRARLGRTLSVIGLVVAMVGVYALVNALSNTELLMHLAERRSSYAQNLLNGLQQYGALVFFRDGEPLGYRETLRWSVDYANAKWLIALLLLLPIYVWRAERFDALLLPTAIAAMMLLVASFGLSSLIVIIVGEPDILRIGSTITILSFIVAVHLVWLLLQALVQALTALPTVVDRHLTWQHVVERWTAQFRRDRPLYISAGATVISILALGLSLVALAGAGTRVVWTPDPDTVTGSMTLDMLLFVGVIVIVGVRIRRGRPQ